MDRRKLSIQPPFFSAVPPAKTTFQGQRIGDSVVIALNHSLKKAKIPDINPNRVRFAFYNDVGYLKTKSGSFRVFDSMVRMAKGGSVRPDQTFNVGEWVSFQNQDHQLTGTNAAIKEKIATLKVEDQSGTTNYKVLHIS